MLEQALLQAHGSSPTTLSLSHSLQLKQLLAAAYYQTEALDRAEEVYRDLLTICNSSSGSSNNHGHCHGDGRVVEPQTILVNLAVVLMDMGDMDQAHQLLTQ